MKKIIYLILILLSLILLNDFAYCQKETLAVLTFENLIGNPQENWLGIGFAETLTTKLSRIKNFQYFSQGAEYYYKGDYKKSIEEFKKALVADPNYNDAKLWIETITVLAKVVKKIPSWRMGIEYH